ncbi:MAG: hydantoinase B/oxoprolinase family protein [Proteobacteria bacterium]|nr:hydantoinase B/oxoprolinase family protein [Pseudomonadota bacterium]
MTDAGRPAVPPARTTSRRRRNLDPVSLEILWTRLISIVDEAAVTFERTSFSTLVRESNDYAVVLTDTRGRSLAQNTRSIPSFICTLPNTVRRFLERFPVETLRPGDALITNDPWMGTGHLPDINVAMPIFHRGRAVAMAAAVSHVPDIGGRLRCTGTRELFEEGLHIPRARLLETGRPNEVIVRMIESNVRVPAQTMGDVWGQVSACRMMQSRLGEMLDEAEVDLAALGAEIQGRAEGITRAAIAAVPDGRYVYEVRNDGFEDSAPITIRCAITVAGDRLHMDFAGSSPQLPRAVNVVPAYTYAYSAYGVKCALAPDTPNNDGSFRPITASAPPGSILNPRFPAAVSARHVVGHLLPPVVLGALAQAVPERVQAAPGSPGCAFNMTGEHQGRRYVTINFLAGGQGASMHADGYAVVCFPSNLCNTPIEVMESEAPVRVLRREVRKRTGGRGRRRGGDGQTFEVRIEAESPAVTTFLLNRRAFAPEGLLGGGPGAHGRLRLNGRTIDPTEPWVVRKGDVIRMQTPGGGGFGAPPKAR